MSRGSILSEMRAARFVIEECYSCGAEFAMTEYFKTERLNDGKTFYCPSGHGQHYTGASKDKQIAELNAEKIALQSRVNAERAQRERAEAAQVRLKKRIANGVCPCCHRTFVNVARHMQSKHPAEVNA